MPPKTAPHASSSKSGKKLLVKLKVDGSKLAAFGQPTSPSKTASSRLANHNHSPRNSSPLAAGGITPDDALKASPKGAEKTAASSVAESVAGGEGTPAESKVEASPAVKAGAKRRAPGTGAGKPGRKKAKVDGIGTATGPASHAKLGPKSNQGAINAQLRALDRSGKPCKRWTKASITLKSFTGVQWSLPKWATPIVDKSLDVPESVSTPPSTNGDADARKPEATTSAKDAEGDVAMSIVVTPPEQSSSTAIAA